MKKCFLYLLRVVGLGACIQSEPLNAEADIMACKILNAKGSPETIFLFPPFPLAINRPLSQVLSFESFRL